MNLRNFTLSAFVLMYFVNCSLPETAPGAVDIGETDLSQDSGVTNLTPPPLADSGSPIEPVSGTDAGAMEVSIDAGAPMPVVDAGAVVTIGEGTDAGSISCEEGYHIDGGICVTIDLCENVDCGPGTCVSDSNGVSCNCNNGYQDNDQNLTCALGCGSISCLQYWLCEDSSGTADCLCDEGTQMVGENCEPIICGENQFVSAHECITCEGGLYNTAGDSAWGVDTTCDAACLEDYHCDSDEECNENNECVQAPCTSHQQCIDEFAEGPAASPDYACSDDGLCFGLASGKCYIDTHCSNDLTTPYCDGNETTLGDCRQCATNNHCIYDDNGNVTNSNGACSEDGYCMSLAPGRCYSDINCEDDTNTTFCYYNVFTHLFNAGECKTCITDAHCVELYGPHTQPGWHYECNNFMCQSVNDGNFPDGPDDERD